MLTADFVIDEYDVFKAPPCLLNFLQVFRIGLDRQKWEHSSENMDGVFRELVEYIVIELYSQNLHKVVPHLKIFLIAMFALLQFFEQNLHIQTSHRHYLLHLPYFIFVVPTVKGQLLMDDAGDNLETPHLVLEIPGTFSQHCEKVVVCVVVPRNVVSNYNVGIFLVRVIVKAVYEWFTDLFLIHGGLFCYDL